MHRRPFFILSICLFLAIEIGFAQSLDTQLPKLQWVINNEVVEGNKVIPANAEITIKLINTGSTSAANNTDREDAHWKRIAKHAMSISSQVDTAGRQVDSVEYHLSAIENQLALIKTVKGNNESITYEMYFILLRVIYTSSTKKTPTLKETLDPSEISGTPSISVKLASYTKDGETIGKVFLKIKKAYRYENNERSVLKLDKKTTTRKFLIKES